MSVIRAAAAAAAAALLACGLGYGALHRLLSAVIRSNSLPLNCLIALTFSTALNVQIVLDFVAHDSPTAPPPTAPPPRHFCPPGEQKICCNTPKAPVDSATARSYIISGAYGFLISRYASTDDVTDVDSGHISERIPGIFIIDAHRRLIGGLK